VAPSQGRSAERYRAAGFNVGLLDAVTLAPETRWRKALEVYG